MANSLYIALVARIPATRERSERTDQKKRATKTRKTNHIASFTRSIPYHHILIAMSAAAFIYDKEASAVNEAAEKALDLINKYSELDPHNTDESNPWRRPDEIFVSLDNARNDLTKSWEVLRLRMEQDKTSKKKNVKEDDFRAAYMNMITDAFSDVLEDIRSKEEEIDVDVLIDILQSGGDLMTQDDKELFLQELGGGDDMEVEHDTKRTPHELRRRQLGFHVETST